MNLKLLHVFVQSDTYPLCTPGSICWEKIGSREFLPVMKLPIKQITPNPVSVLMNEWAWSKQVKIWITFNVIVLGSARTGLIFTGIQEGAQPGRLTPPGQTEQGIPYHVPSCWVLVGGSWAGGTLSQLGSTKAVSESGSVLGFVLCILLICIVVVPVPFVCCSVKLPLSWPISFCLFLSILLRTRRREGWPRGAFVAGHSQTITQGNLKMKIWVIICCIFRGNIYQLLSTFSLYILVGKELWTR